MRFVYRTDRTLALVYCLPSFHLVECMRVLWVGWRALPVDLSLWHQANGGWGCESCGETTLDAWKDLRRFRAAENGGDCRTERV